MRENLEVVKFMYKILLAWFFPDMIYPKWCWIIRRFLNTPVEYRWIQKVKYHVIYTVSEKKVPIFAITLPNPNRSSRFFYTQQYICNKQIIKYPTAILKLLCSKILNYIVGLYYKRLMTMNSYTIKSFVVLIRTF